MRQAVKTAEDGCREHPEFDPASKSFFYWRKMEGGEKQGMFRQWCQSEWIPQEIWYKYVPLPSLFGCLLFASEHLGDTHVRCVLHPFLFGCVLL